MLLISNTEELIQNIKEQIKRVDQKLIDQVKSIDKQVNDLITKLDLKLTNQLSEIGKDTDIKITSLKEEFNLMVEDLEKRIGEQITKTENKLNAHLNTLNNKLNDHISSVENNIKTISESIITTNNDFFGKFKTMKEEMNTKDDILRDMLKKFEIETDEYKNSLKPVLENLKSQQDLVKISVDVLKKQIHESAKEWISDEIRLACKNKEREILMNLWIDELKEIVNNLEQLKETNPKVLKLYLNEISTTLASFRQRFMT